MNKSFLIVMSLLSVSCNLFSYPQAELGLISNYNLPEGRMAPGGRGSLGRGSLAQGHLGQRQQQKINLTKEKRKDGSDSLVFKVNHLPQFLFLSTMQPKPVIIGFFSGDDDTLLYQGIADKLKDIAVFVSVYPAHSPDLANLFSMILKFEGLNSVLGNNKKYPFFLFCNRDFVFIQNKSVSFKKKSIKLLGKPGVLVENEFLVNIEKNVPKTYLNQTKDLKSDQTQQMKSSLWQNYKDKFRKWIGSKKGQ